MAKFFYANKLNININGVQFSGGIGETKDERLIGIIRKYPGMVELKDEEFLKEEAERKAKIQDKMAKARAAREANLKAKREAEARKAKEKKTEEDTKDSATED